MAMMNCPECHNEISSDVWVCPSCGFKLFNTTSLPATIAIVIFLFVAIGETIQSLFQIPQAYLISLVISVAMGIYGYNKRATPNK